MAYEIWDGASGNLLIVRSTESEALLVVREAIASHGADYVDDLALIFEDGQGDSHVIAEGRQLVALASGEAVAVSPTSRPIQTRRR